jgi:hypothetical protein
MKTYPYGTTKEQWDQYQEEMNTHEQRMEKKKPNRADYEHAEEYYSAHQHWIMESLMDAPNKPGYYRANND